MKTKTELEALKKEQLVAELNSLSAQLDEPLPKGGTNAEMIERILTAQERLDLSETETPDDSEDSDVSPASYTISANAKTGFYRCGKFWPHEGREISADQLSDNELAQLKAEKNLTVE